MGASGFYLYLHWVSLRNRSIVWTVGVWLIHQVANVVTPWVSTSWWGQKIRGNLDSRCVRNRKVNKAAPNKAITLVLINTGGWNSMKIRQARGLSCERSKTQTRAIYSQNRVWCNSWSRAFTITILATAELQKQIHHKAQQPTDHDNLAATNQLTLPRAADPQVLSTNQLLLLNGQNVISTIALQQRPQ